MKSKSYKICLFILFTINTFAQENFEIYQIKDSKKNIEKVENKFKKNKVLFNDKNYLITSTCSGEWGGTIKFRDKSTQKIYSAESTCPVSVDKLNDEFYITNSLAHLSGSTEILKIKNPTEMEIYEVSKPRKVKGRYMKYVGDDESHSKKGTEQLLDSIGAFTLATFQNQNRFYYIVTDFEKTYLSKIENKKFRTISELPITDVWSYDTKIIKLSNNHIILLFNDEKVKGYLEAENNNLKIITE